MDTAKTKAVMMAAYKLEPKQGIAKMIKQAEWLQREHADAAASLREGLHETFTVNALGLPSSLTRCLCTTASSRTQRHRAPDEPACHPLPRRGYGAALDRHGLHLRVEPNSNVPYQSTIAPLLAIRTVTYCTKSRDPWMPWSDAARDESIVKARMGASSWSITKHPKPPYFRTLLASASEMVFSTSSRNISP